MAQQLPNPLQFQGSAESKRFAPITPASSTKAAVEDANRLSQSWQEAAQFNLNQEKRAIAFKDGVTQDNVRALAGFSQTLTKKLTEIQEQTELDKEVGAQYDYLLQGFDESVPTNTTPEQHRLNAIEHQVEDAANVGGDAAARFSYEVERDSGNPVMGNLAWQQTGGLARGFRAQEAVLMQARSSYNGFLAAFLQSGATIRINGQDVNISEAVNSGDPALTNAAITAARFQFIRQNGLHLATKDAFIKHFAPTMLATEGAISGQLVLGAIKGQREARQQELEGLGYNLAQNTTPDQTGSAFETLSRQFFQGGLGISRGQANELAVKALISGFEDKGDIDSLQALLDVQQVPGQANTELRRRFGNEINDAIRRAQGIADDNEARTIKDVEAGMYEQLAGATTQQQRDAIIERTAQQLEASGLYRQARALRQERDELSVAGSNELNTARLEAGLRDGSATPEQVEQAILRGDITREQGDRLLRETGGGGITSEDKNNPLFRGIADAYGDRIETDFLNRAQLKKDAYGRLLPSETSLITDGQARIITQAMRNDIQRVKEQSLMATVGKGDEERQRHLTAALNEWYNNNFVAVGSKYHIPEADKGGKIKDKNGIEDWNPEVRRRLINLTTSPATLSHTNFPRSVRPYDWSGYVEGTSVPTNVARWFRRLRGDRLFDEQTLNVLRDDFERNGNIQQGLQRTAQQLGLSPLALLNQQLIAYGKEPVSNMPNQSVGSGDGAPTSAVRGAQLLMSMGVPAKGAAWLAGNIQQESGWNGQRQPWNDNGALSGGLVSWRAGRLTNAANAAGNGDIRNASTQAQLRFMLDEMRSRYPEAYRVFMNPRATDRQLIRASQIYWVYGEEGARYTYAREVEGSLSGRATGTVTGSGSQRAVEVGKQLLARGIRMWQNPAFDLDRGHVGSGGRVGTHSSNSYHYSGQAIDIPLSHNSERQLIQTFEYLRKNMKRFGIVELFYDKGGYYRDGRQIGRPGSNTIQGHTGHIHIAFG